MAQAWVLPSAVQILCITILYFFWFLLESSYTHLLHYHWVFQSYNLSLYSDRYYGLLPTQIWFLQHGRYNNIWPGQHLHEYNF